MATANTEAAPTVRALLARRDLALRLESGDDEALDRPIRWVHSTDLADPTPFLSEGLVLLTTGTQFQSQLEDPAPYRAYVERLVRRGVLALGFGTEVVRDGIPPALVEACAASALPLFEVPYRTPFIAVARANAEAIAAQAYSRRTWALAAQRAIALAALRPDGLGATVAELARQLDAWVGMYDAAGELTRQHPPAGLAPDTASALRDEVGAVLARGARAGSHLRIGEATFTMQTLGRGGRLRGVIAIAAGDLDQEGRGVVTSVIAMAGLALEQNQGLSRARNALRAGLVTSLVSGDPALARRISRDLWGPLPAAPVLIALTDAATARADAPSEFLELRADEYRGGVFFGRTEDGLALMLPAAHEGVLTELVERFDARVGVSVPTGHDGIPGALAQARAARDRPGAGLSRFADVAGAGVLSALGPDAAALAAAELSPLTSHDAEHGTALVDTVRTWLESDCAHEATARTLGIHRHTVRARLTQAERLLGTDFSSFGARAELWAAFRLAG